MKECRVTLNVLADYLDGVGDTEVRQALGQHIAEGCLQCRNSLHWLRRTLGALAQVDAGKQAPDAAIARARALYREQFRPPLSIALPAFLARLVFDSRSSPVAVGARGERTAAYHQIFSADAYDIDIWQEPMSDVSWYLIGQVLPIDVDEIVVPEAVVLYEASGDLIPSVEEAGEFHIPAVPEGTYQVHLRLADREVIIPEVVVGAPR